MLKTWCNTLLTPFYCSVMQVETYHLLLCLRRLSTWSCSQYPKLWSCLRMGILRCRQLLPLSNSLAVNSIPWGQRINKRFAIRHIYPRCALCQMNGRVVLLKAKPMKVRWRSDSWYVVSAARPVLSCDSPNILHHDDDLLPDFCRWDYQSCQLIDTFNFQSNPQTLLNKIRKPKDDDQVLLTQHPWVLLRQSCPSYLRLSSNLELPHLCEWEIAAKLFPVHPCRYA